MEAAWPPRRVTLRWDKSFSHDPTGATRMSAILGPDSGEFKGLACDLSMGTLSPWSGSYPRLNLIDHDDEGQHG